MSPSGPPSCSPGTAAICSSHAIPSSSPRPQAGHLVLFFPFRLPNPTSALPPGSHLSSLSTPCYPGPAARSHKEALWAQEHGSCSCGSWFMFMLCKENLQRCVVRKVSGGYTPSPAVNAKVGGGAASGSSEHHGTECREKQAD